MKVTLVIAAAESDSGPMASRIPVFLHPVAGRPLIWHTLSALLNSSRPPDQVLVFLPPEFAGALPEDLPASVRAVPLDASFPRVQAEIDALPERVLMVRGSACFDIGLLDGLEEGVDTAWLGSSPNDPVAIGGGAEAVRAVVAAGDLGLTPIPTDWRRVGDDEAGFGVRSRADLARMQRKVRDRLVQSLMEGGTTFLIPDSVVVDVDVRTGRDTIIYPGVVLEGQTTVGDETVIGPGCRVIDSWIGSGVELKGWNYISHTSVRNRAILEPYVRRGFD